MVVRVFFWLASRTSRQIPLFTFTSHLHLSLPRPPDRLSGAVHVPRRGARRDRRLVPRIPEVEKRPVAEVLVRLERLDALVAGGVPDERQPYALVKERLHRLADERQVRRRRDEVPVLDLVLHRELAEDPGQFGDRLVHALAAPAPRRVLAVEALHRAAREEDAAAAALARQGRLLAEVRPPPEDARRPARAAEPRPLPAPARTQLAFVDHTRYYTKF